MGQLGFFDADKRLAALSAKGDPLVAIDRLVPWETFRADIEAVVLTPEEMRKSSAGRKPLDAIVIDAISLPSNELRHPRRSISPVSLGESLELLSNQHVDRVLRTLHISYRPSAHSHVPAGAPLPHSVFDEHSDHVPVSLRPSLFFSSPLFGPGSP